MPWEKMNKLFTNKVLLIFVFIVLFAATRLPYLGKDAINPDAVNWHYRSEQFVVGLKNGIWEKTYQHYHPGVTLMWVLGPTVEVARQINPEFRVYDHHNFLYLHTLGKQVLVAVQLILSLGVLYVFSKILGFYKGFFVTALFSLEPFFIGNSRMLHMDVLLTLFLCLGLGLAYLGLFSGKAFSKSSEGTVSSTGLSSKGIFKTGNPSIALIFSGVFLALAFLTKSIAIGAILFVLGMAVLVKLKTPKELPKTLLLILVPFVAALFLFFPALWVEPVHTIVRIFDEAERVGIRKGHGQIYFGKYTRDPGLFFYPVVIFLKTSPVLLLGVLAFLATLLKASKGKPLVRFFRDNEISFLGFLTIFFAGYMLVMTISSKKIDRYLVPLFPYLSLMAVLGFASLKKIKSAVIVSLSLLALLALNYKAHPYQFTYTTPLVGSAERAHWMVAQKPFGIGIPYLKELILDSYGKNYPPLGFYDTKPMKTIYPATKVADVDVNGVSDYVFLILGPNEEMPEEVLDSPYPFELDKVVNINGLDYWRIYDRKGNPQD
ncbi:hypothetical protein GF360_02295 [candidate division WWE3 bacterium]|nr:hypothetical protein [candidate division WWE3 bacterium]